MIIPLINIIGAIFAIILLIAILSVIVICIMESNKTNIYRSNRESFWKYLSQINHVVCDDFRSIWKGIAFYAFMVLVVLGIIISIAYFVPLEKCWLWNIIEKFFQDHSVIASIVGTLVGLILTFALLRPRLILQKAYIYKHINQEEPYDSLSFCIKNIGLFPVNNVEVSVFWLRKPKNNIHPNDKPFQHEWKTKRIEMFRPEINSINGILSKENSTYSCHAIESIAQNKAKREEANKRLIAHLGQDEARLVEGEQLFGDTILCRVQATHSLSGIMKVYEWIIDAQDIE